MTVLLFYTLTHKHTHTHTLTFTYTETHTHTWWKKPGQLSRDQPPTVSASACFINGVARLCRFHNSYCAHRSVCLSRHTHTHIHTITEIHTDTERHTNTQRKVYNKRINVALDRDAHTCTHIYSHMYTHIKCSESERVRRIVRREAKENLYLKKIRPPFPVLLFFLECF